MHEQRWLCLQRPACCGRPQVMVFLSSCNSVKYHAELLNYVDIPVRDIHGKQKQAKRTSTFFEFCGAETGTLLCTDVAARGLDIPGTLAMGLDGVLDIFILPASRDASGRHWR
jgi:superfamily II DNA/RNA helicase